MVPMVKKVWDEIIKELKDVHPTLGHKHKSNLERKRDAMQLCKDKHIFAMEKAKPGAAHKKEDVWKLMMDAFVSDRYTGRVESNPSTHETFRCTAYQHSNT